MHYSSLQSHFPISPSIGITWQHIWIVWERCLGLTTTVTLMREPDNLLKHEPVAWQQIALFHGVLGTARAWKRPATHCVTCHCNWQPDPKLQLGQLGLFHSSIPPPLFHLPHWRTPLSASPPCHGKTTKTLDHVFVIFCANVQVEAHSVPSLPPPFNQAISRSSDAHVREMCSYCCI